MWTSLDSEPNAAFPVYSARNFAEVAPARLSPISWSVVGAPVERGCRALVSRMWPRATWQTGSHYVFVGYFACRPYHNLSAYCHVADLLPLHSASDVTASYFESVEPPPRKRGYRPTLFDRARLPQRLVSEYVSLRPRLQLLDGRVSEVESKVRKAARANPLALADAVFAARDLLGDAWGVHYSTTSILVPIQGARRRLGERLTDHWSELELLLDRPRELVWGMLHQADETGFLERAFYEIADEHEPWSGYASHGAPRVETAPRERDPVHDLGDLVWEMYPRVRRAGLAELTEGVVEVLEARERSKSLAMRLLHAVRRLAPAVASCNGVPADDWPLLTLDELLEGGGGLADKALARREQVDVALAVELADELDFSAGPNVPPEQIGAEPAARGVSSGTVRGVVVDTALQPDVPGMPKILACESADADLQPLLPRLDGVITARGSLLSHVSILTRERGIPAVVGYRAVAELTPGRIVFIDGTSGEVRVDD